MLIGYRCKVCGAPVDPETGYCQYCDTMNFKPIIRKPLKDDGKPRLIVRSRDKEAELTPTKLSLTLEDDPLLEVTSLGDDYRRFIPAIRHTQYARFSVQTNLTEEAVDVLSNPIFDVVFTGFRVGYAHEFEGFAQYMDQNIWISNDPMWRFDIVSVRPVDFWNTSRIHNPILEGMRCPICGADLDPEKSKCDYCGYWWIYSPDG